MKPVQRIVKRAAWAVPLPALPTLAQQVTGELGSPDVN